ncbi:MAG TPA: HesA/MoeB/ThiF family protein, partial [Candidatus Dormibacteraeota bacterium]|nr:HesA/MoeB/ThiF family protein [Candidatus Dormibacteraeota bacterium]
IDDDAVSLDNLPRQPLHDEAALGTGKAQSAARRLTALNGAVQCRVLRRRLAPENARALLAGHDCIVDGSDNFPTKFLVNDVALALGIPAVIGGVLGFRGQLLVVPPGGPCYRCLFGGPPPVGRVGDCRTAGVLGALAGIIGSLQGMEALKLLLGIGESLAGRVQEYEALSGRWRQVRFPRAGGCPACGGA